MSKDNRFVQTYTQGNFIGSLEIWIDKETGVNYLFRISGNGGGLTPLLNSEGKPLITPIK